MEWERSGDTLKRIAELASHKLMRNYARGQACNVLYVKNISRKATEEQLLSLFGRYWPSRAEAQRFDGRLKLYASNRKCRHLHLRLMDKGRMKGQAFVTFPNTRMAETALDDVLGFCLNGKPLIIVRSRPEECLRLNPWCAAIRKGQKVTRLRCAARQCFVYKHPGCERGRNLPAKNGAFQFM